MNPPQSYDSSISPISFTDPRTSQRSKISINNPNEDFFTALEMEMETTMRQDATPSTRGKNDAKYSDPMQSSSRDASNVRTSSTGPSKKQGKNTPGKNTNNSEDDFFTALEKELESTLRQDAGSTTRGKTTAAADDFFAMLEAELSLSSPSSNAPRDRIDKTSASNPTSNLDDFLSEMYSEFETQTPLVNPRRNHQALHHLVKVRKSWKNHFRLRTLLQSHVKKSWRRNVQAPNHPRRRAVHRRLAENNPVRSMPAA